MNNARIAALTFLCIFSHFLFDSAELLRECSMKTNQSTDAANHVEFVIRFIERLRWTNALILTNHEQHRLIKKFTLKSIPVATHRTKMDLSNLMHFRSVIFMDNHQNFFDLISKVVQHQKSSLQNWLVVTTTEIASLPQIYIPHELNVIFAISQRVDELTLFRLYSESVNTVKKVPFGNWRKNTNVLKVKYNPTPLPSLTGETFRITTIEFSPHFSPKLLLPGDGEEPSGIYGKILQILVHKMNFTYTVRPPEDGSFGNVVNSTFATGMLRLLKDNEADIIIALDLYGPRLAVIDFSHTVTTVAVHFVYRNREVARWRFLFFFNPFSPGLWVSIAAVCVVIATLFWIIRETQIAKFGAVGLENLQRHSNDKFSRFKSFLWFILVSYYTFLRTGFDYVATGAASKIVLFVLHAFSLVVYVQYSSILISVLTVNEKPVPFRSLEDLIYKSDYAVGTVQGASAEDIFQNSQSDVNKKVWQRMQRDSDRYLTTTFQQGIDLAYAEKYAYLMDSLVLSLMTRGNCSMHIAEKTVYYSYVAFGYRKKFRYKKIFDKYLQLIAESGILRKIERKYSPPNHNEACKLTGWQRVLDKRALVGLLVIIGFGIIVSLLALCVEIAIEIIYIRQLCTANGF